MYVPKQYMLRWEINTECNLPCAHCCNADSSIDRRESPLTFTEIKCAIEKLSREGLKKIHFLGGEPLLRDDFLEICNICSSQDVEVSFNTNGLLLKNQSLIHKILDIPFVSITISIDGPDAESHDTLRGMGTFKRVISAASQLVRLRNERGKSRPTLIMQSTLTRLWYNKIEELFVLAKRLGAEGIVINNLALEGRAKRHTDILSLTHEQEFNAAGRILQASHDHPELIVMSPFRAKVAVYYRQMTGVDISCNPFTCKGGVDTAYVLPNGKILPCMVSEISGIGDPFQPTKIQDVNSLTLWNSEYMVYFRQLVHGSICETYKNVLPCNECSFLGFLCKPCPLSLNPDNKPIIMPCKIANDYLSSNK